MKVLIACEFSGIVRDSFIAKGHNAISCDILPTDFSGPHYQGDVKDITLRMFREFYQFMWMNRSYWEPRLRNA